MVVGLAQKWCMVWWLSRIQCGGRDWVMTEDAMVVVTRNNNDSGGCVVVGYGLLKDGLFGVAEGALLCLKLVF